MKFKVKLKIAAGVTLVVLMIAVVYLIQINLSAALHANYADLGPQALVAGICLLILFAIAESGG